MSAHKQRAPMAAVGSYESILPFKAIGLDVVVVTEENRAAVPQTLSKFSRSGYAALSSKSRSTPSSGRPSTR